MPPASPTTRGEHDDAEEVELRAHRGQPAAEPEDERPRQVEPQDQRRVEAVAGRPSRAELAPVRGRSARTG